MSRPAAPAERLAPVDWALAERVGVRIAGRTPQPPAHHLPSVAEMDDLVARAETLVGDHTGLHPLTPARAQVLSREDWVRVNVASFRRLLTPLWERWTQTHPVTSTSSSFVGSVGPKVSATQIGTLLGWMSARVLGQYDVLVATPDANRDTTSGDTTSNDTTSNDTTSNDTTSNDTTSNDTTSGDDVYLVGTNLVALEQRYAFAPEQFRLWVALHEVTHRAQFLGVPWMRDHYLGLVDQMLTIADPDPARLWSAVRAALSDRETSRAALRDGGAVAVLAGPEQRAALDRIAGLMSLLEGHGDVTMDRAGASQLPDALRFAHVLRMRRANAAPLTRFVQRLIGLEAKLDQYRAGEAFITAVEAVEGPAVIDRCWQAPTNLPTLAEIREPEAWLARTASTPTSPPPSPPSPPSLPSLPSLPSSPSGTAGLRSAQPSRARSDEV